MNTNYNDEFYLLIMHLNFLRFITLIDTAAFIYQERNRRPGPTDDAYLVQQFLSARDVQLDRL